MKRHPTMPALVAAGPVQRPKVAPLAFLAEDFSRLQYGPRRFVVRRGRVRVLS